MSHLVCGTLHVKKVIFIVVSGVGGEGNRSMKKNLLASEYPELLLCVLEHNELTPEILK